MKTEQDSKPEPKILKSTPNTEGLNLGELEPLTEQEYTQMMQWRPKHAFFESIGVKSRVEEMEIPGTGIVLLCRITTRRKDGNPPSKGKETWGNPEWRRANKGK
jgi:hypothetical protein